MAVLVTLSHCCSMTNDDTTTREGSSSSIKTTKRVLVVDDDEDLREAVRDVLTLAGYEAVGAIDGAAAVRVLREEHFDLIVTDLRMPGMDGWQLLAVLQCDQALRRIPVCVLSSEDYAPALPIRVIRKPFEASSLVELVGALLSRECQQRCAA
jgi:CheY-like chemotaxis protein